MPSRHESTGHAEELGLLCLLGGQATGPANGQASCPRSTGVSASSTPGSSIVDGTGSSRPSAMSRMVLRRILPDLVFGNAATTSTFLEKGHRADVRAHRSDQVLGEPVGRRPGLEHYESPGTWPFISSATPITAHSATAGRCASTASIDPVDSRCPATLMTSSVRPITNR